MNRGLIAALAVSLGVNLFLLGAGASMLVMRGRVARLEAQAAAAAQPNRNQPGGTVVAIRRALRALGPEQRRALAQAIRARQDQIRPLNQASRAARVQAADLLEQPAVDRAAVIAALSRARDTDAAARAQTMAAIMEVVVGLDPQDRAAVAEAIRPPPPSGAKP